MCPRHGDGAGPPLSPALPASRLRVALTVLTPCLGILLLLRFTTLHLLLPSLSTVVPVLSLSVVSLASFLLYRTFTFPDYQLSSPPKPPPFFSNARETFHSTRNEMAARLAGALAIPTISHDHVHGEVSRNDSSHLLALHKYLRLSYPLVHERMELTVINKYSLLYKMQGTDESFPHSPLTSPTPDLPLLFLAHLDVVPVPDADLWQHPPFSGRVANNRVYGRGAIDDKNNVCALLEVCEHLLTADLRPKRSLYFAFGHDEEIGGDDGAAHIAQHLKAKGVHFEFSLDEGLFIVNRLVPGYPKPVALVCTGEKGAVSVELKVALKPSDAGHSSVPGRDSAIAILGRALNRIHDAAMPTYYSPRDREMMEWLARGFPFPMRLLMSNLWLFGPLVKAMMARKPQTAATVRSTSALTVVRAGDKHNVVPHTASAIVNHRVHPADSCEGVLRFDRAMVADERVEVKTKGWKTEPSQRSSTSSPAFRLLHESVMTVFPHVSLAPCLMVAGTDTKHYEAAGLCDSYFRFSVTELDKEELPMFHGRDESIDVSNLANTALWYYTVIMKADKQDWGTSTPPPQAKKERPSKPQS